MPHLLETPIPIAQAPPNGGVLGLIAGFGELPVSVARQAITWGWQVVAFCIHRDNRRALKKIGATVIPTTPGLVEKHLASARAHQVTHGVFAGKVNKWQLLTNPVLDSRALQVLNHLRQRRDDDIMVAIVDLIESEGFQILPQTDFLQDHFLPPGQLTGPPLTDWQQQDVAYGWQLAKAMGGLDVGQTVVVHQGMPLAIEAIEGTDQCLKRAGKWGQKKGGTVVKVAKPNQDNRFDVPTVGLKTLKAMKRAKLTVLAAEAHQTFFLDPEAMVAYANKHGMTIVVCNNGEVSAS